MHTRERSMTYIHMEGKPTRAMAEATGQSPSKNPDAVLINSSENNGWKSLWRGPAQHTDHVDAPNPLATCPCN